MAKFEMAMDEVIIEAEALAYSALEPELKKVMFEVLADHGLKMDKKQTPDGGSQKENSEPYKTKKATKGIRVGGRYVRGEVQTILTGEMKSSRQVSTEGQSVTGKFSGRNAGKARGLVARGYKIHFFSKQNIDWVTKKVGDFLGKAPIITIRKK